MNYRCLPGAGLRCADDVGIADLLEALAGVAGLAVGVFTDALAAGLAVRLPCGLEPFMWDMLTAPE